MASTWKLGSVDAYTSDYQSEGDVNIAKLTPLDANNSSSVQFFGAGSEAVKITCWIFGETNKGALETYRNAGTSITLTSDQGNEGSFKIMSLSFKRVDAISVNISGITSTATVYKAQVQLVKV